jgi:invasion protein IalB
MNRTHRLTAAIAATTMLATAAPLLAQTEAPRNGQRFGNWVLNCEAVGVNQTVCVLTQRFVRTADQAYLGDLLAFANREGDKLYLAARVPVGAYLPSGFSIRPEASEEQTVFVWQTCTPQICEAVIELTADQITALEGAGDILGGYRLALGAEPVVFRFQMAGVTEGLAALTGANAP